MSATYLYEIHLTFDHHGNEAKFLELCKELDIKPIILDLDGETQVTTSCVVKTANILDVDIRVGQLVHPFRIAKIDLLRTKLETTIDNPLIDNPLIGYLFHDDHTYYETHFSFLTTPEEKERVTHFCKLYGVHMSRNALKCDHEGLTKYMGTVRDGNDATAHTERVKTILQYLKNNGIEPIKSVTEYAYWDSTKELDNNWMKL